MASISEQTTDPKRARYKVRWREADGSARSESLADNKAALRREARDRAVRRGRESTSTTVTVGSTVAEWSRGRAFDGWIDLERSSLDRYRVVLDPSDSPPRSGLDRSGP